MRELNSFGDSELTMYHMVSDEGDFLCSGGLKNCNFYEDPEMIRNIRAIAFDYTYIWLSLFMRALKRIGDNFSINP